MLIKTYRSRVDAVQAALRLMRWEGHISSLRDEGNIGQNAGPREVEHRCLYPAALTTSEGSIHCPVPQGARGIPRRLEHAWYCSSLAFDSLTCSVDLWKIHDLDRKYRAMIGRKEKLKTLCSQLKEVSNLSPQTMAHSVGTSINA